MFRKLGFKMLVVCCVLTASFMLTATRDGFCNEPGGEVNVKGPAIVGNIVIEDDESGLTSTAIFRGRCKNNDNIEIPFSGLQDTASIDIVGLGGTIIPDEFIPDECGVGDVVINTVMRYNYDPAAGRITANVVVMFVR